jgi:aquaporin Z
MMRIELSNPIGTGVSGKLQAQDESKPGRINTKLKGMMTTLKAHWPEYLIEASGLGFFMLSACLFSALLFHPASPLVVAIETPLLRRLLMGVAMGTTAITIIYSPWGKRSGAHTNPATTLTFFRLGKIAPWDAAFYVVAQFAGGLVGVMLAAALLGKVIADPAVNYAATLPGEMGLVPAFIAEVLISFVLMSVILRVSNAKRWNRFTGLCAGLLVASYITLESPISGMSMNPARTFASAVPAHAWMSLWIYFTAPILGMLTAGQIYSASNRRKVACAKLHHQNNQRCIFRCDYAEL